MSDKDSQNSNKKENGAESDIEEAERGNSQREACEHDDMDVSVSPLSSSRSDILCGVSNVVYRKEWAIAFKG